MTLDTPITTTAGNIISLISCAWDYGHTNGVIMGALFELIDYNLTEEMIEEYAKSVAAQEGYEEEDYESIKESLEDWANKYNKPRS